MDVSINKNEATSLDFASFLKSGKPPTLQNLQNLQIWPVGGAGPEPKTPGPAKSEDSEDSEDLEASLILNTRRNPNLQPQGRLKIWISSCV